MSYQDLLSDDELFTRVWDCGSQPDPYVPDDSPSPTSLGSLVSTQPTSPYKPVVRHNFPLSQRTVPVHPTPSVTHSLHHNATEFLRSAPEKTLSVDVIGGTAATGLITDQEVPILNNLQFFFYLANLHSCS